MKKQFSLKTLVFLLIFVIISMTAIGCGGGEDTTEKSKLSGTYTYSEAIGADKSLYMTTSLFNAKDQVRKYLITTVYPMRMHTDLNNDGTEDQTLCYTIDQRLKLNKDYTYIYEYTILISNPNDWGGKVAQVAVNMSGTFTYLEDTSEDGIYKAYLSNPTAGTQEIYSFDVVGSGSYGYSIHTAPDMVIDLGYLATLSHYDFDKYTCGREVVVNKTEKSVIDDVFFYDVLDYVAPYCRY